MLVLLQMPSKYQGFLRNVTFRAQLFVNHLTINNMERMDHNHLKSQNFWYSICQLVMGKRAQTKHSRKDHNNKGHSDCLSAACFTLVVLYLDHIVENFEIHQMFRFMKPFQITGSHLL